MPTYDYICPNGHRFEVVHSVTAEGPTACPICGASPVRKAFAPPTIHFKGSGWAKKDRGAAARSKARDGVTAGTGSDGSGSDGGGSDGAGPDSGGSDKHTAPTGDSSTKSGDSSKGGSSPATDASSSKGGRSSGGDRASSRETRSGSGGSSGGTGSSSGGSSAPAD
jgi:putative FmdB family regulatory protein